MDLGLTAALLAPLAVVIAGAVAYLALRALLELRQARRAGALVAVDLGGGPGFASPRLGLVGRPDELRRQADGRFVPVEFKSREGPRNGPPRSHRIQVTAYALLLEEATGRPPPYGLLRYGDGATWEVPYTAEARAEVIDLLEELRAPYDGRANPSRGRCAGCRWRPACPVRAA